MASDFTPSKVLVSLFQLRFIAVTAQLVVVAYAVTVLGMALPLSPLLLLVGGLFLWNLLVWWRLHPYRLQRWAPTSMEAGIHLAIDITVLTGLLYWAGGPANPFVSLYLVPIALAAATLPAVHAWLITGLCIGAYCLLFWQHVPLPHAQGHGNDDFSLHVLGMWANFILSALLIAAFVTLLATAIRRRDRSLARQREAALHSERLIALGTQAAGAAHELNTPLASMSILVDELRQTRSGDPGLTEDLAILSGQINLCRDRLHELVDRVNTPREGDAVSAGSMLDEVIRRWSLLRPEIRIDQERSPGMADVGVSADPTLVQALINLLVNAADASAASRQDSIRLSAWAEAGQLWLLIDDFGDGLGETEQAGAGEVFLTTKTGGLGMGLVLSNATLERLGGRVTLENRPPGHRPGGVRASISVPLQASS